MDKRLNANGFVTGGVLLSPPVAGGSGLLGIPREKFPEAPQKNEISWEVLFLWN